jgi:hypothetical protein
VDKALEIARYTQEDPCNGLAEKELLATQFPDLDIWHPAVMDAQAAIERALLCEAAGREEARVTNSEGASFDAGLGMGVYGNSHGFIGRSAGTGSTKAAWSRVKAPTCNVITVTTAAATWQNSKRRPAPGVKRLVARLEGWVRSRSRRGTCPCCWRRKWPKA